MISPNIVLTVDHGHAEITSRALLKGTRFGPITVGSRGHWVIEAPGVEEVHLVLWFDGGSLRIAAQPNCRVLLNGEDVGLEFRIVSVPSDICFGDARFGVGPELDAPSAETRPEPTRPPSIAAGTPTRRSRTPDTERVSGSRSDWDSDELSAFPEPLRRKGGGRPDSGGQLA